MKIAAIILAIVFFVVGLGYAMGWLQFMVSSAEAGGHHVKHAILFWVLALLALIWYRFQSAPQTR